MVGKRFQDDKLKYQIPARESNKCPKTKTMCKKRDKLQQWFSNYCAPDHDKGLIQKGQGETWKLAPLTGSQIMRTSEDCIKKN